MSASPFRKILIANRGEIALRIQRTAHALGYRTVAVYSAADRAARHVREAHQAVFIGDSPPRDSYLNIPALLAAARRSGADAVHPGYGFLAENADFAEACRDAGLVFIGPSPAAIRAMGHKAGAKRIMSAAGVPCVPGYDGDDQSDARMLAEADKIGLPLMIKAALGGGGRGMRLVTDARELPESLARARSEATSAFGDGTLILERAISSPRHVEIQVLADRYGNAIHLGERDCSVQRRHQKLVEESPSPAVDPELRARMGEAALKGVNAIAYEGAGTLEFLLDRTGHFYFMEMNTRLQVEHPVTEQVTGLDLVELQLRIAAGEELPLKQDAVQISGHSIEVRLCAENAEASFLPASGRMLAWRMPSAIRVEHALESGAEIPPFYDSMIAKFVAHGRTRDEARRKLGAGLEDAVALGVVTNQAFLASCIEHPVFAAGDATTAFIEQNATDLLARDPEVDARAAAVSALLFVALAAASAPPRRTSDSLPLTQRILLGTTEQVATLTPQGENAFGMSVGGYSFALRVVTLGAEDFRFECDDLVESAAYVLSGVTLFVQYRGRSFQAEDRSRQKPQPNTTGGPGDGKLRAAMNGRITAVHVAVGDALTAGQTVVTVEAMKMENLHSFQVDGTIKAIFVKAGDQVSGGKVLAELE